MRLLALMMETVRTPLCWKVMMLLVARRISFRPGAFCSLLGACFRCAASPEDLKGQYWISHSSVATICM